MLQGRKSLVYLWTGSAILWLSGGSGVGVVWGWWVFVPVMVWVLNVFGHLLRPGLCWCLLGSREELNTTLLNYTVTQHNLGRFSGEPGLGSHREMGRVDKHIAVCTSTDNIAIIKGSGEVGDSPIMVVVHGEGPVGLEGGEGVRVGEGVHPHTAIRGSRQQVFTRRTGGRYIKMNLSIDKLSTDKLSIISY